MTAGEFKFCPRCAGGLRVSDVGHPASPHPVCTECGFVIWLNLKPSVEALIVRGSGTDTEVLLGRLGTGSNKGLWDIPGGFLNANDRLRDALRRECLREMDISVEIGDLLGVYEGQLAGGRIISIVYVCTIASGEARAADIIDEVQWFPLIAMPVVAYPAVQKAIEALQRRLAG